VLIQIFTSIQFLE